MENFDLNSLIVVAINTASDFQKNIIVWLIIIIVFFKTSSIGNAIIRWIDKIIDYKFENKNKNGDK